MTRRFSTFVVAFALAVPFTLGCTTKRYVREQTTPLINHVNELDDLTARNSNEIREVDARTQKGIQAVQEKATEVDQKALSAGRRAEEAQTLASHAANRVNVLQTRLANFDNYRPVVETSVHFGFDKWNLTSRAKKALDQLAAEVPNAKSYIVEIVGGTDYIGDKEYNYRLSERRAAAVVQYLAQEHSIPAHKIFVIGLGKDKPVESNATRSGRAKNRRVDVRLLTNTVEGTETAAQGGVPTPQN
jgi:OOP family OmpA-OmpF porin